jgi:hypothetical protein
MGVELRRLIFGTATVVDDRAQRVEIVTSAEMLAPLTTLQRILLWRWLGPAFFLAIAISAFAAPEVVLALLFMLWWLIPVVVFLLIGSRNRRLLALSRGALAAGLCGACGYRIEDQHTAADGKRVCPECGGAWMANAPPPPPDEAAVIFRRHYALWYGRTMVGSPTIRDDRGCLMPRMARNQPEEAATLHALGIRGLAYSSGPTAVWVKRTVVGIVMLLLALFVLAGISEFGPRWSWTAISVTLSLAALLAGAGAFLIWRTHFSLDRAGILRAGLCPACTQPISGATPEADGCVKCPSCWAAWRATDIQRPMAPPPQEA